MYPLDRLRHVSTRLAACRIENPPVDDAAGYAVPAAARVALAHPIAPDGRTIESALDALVAPFSMTSRQDLTAIIRALLAHDPYLIVLVRRAG